MFLQIISEHQGHLLIGSVVVILMLAGFLLLFGLFNKKFLKKINKETQFVNFEVQAKRKSKKKRGKNERK